MLLYTRGKPQTTYCGVILDTRSIVVRTGTGRHSVKLKWHRRGRGKDKITMLLKPLQLHMQMLVQLLKSKVCIYCIGCGPSNQMYIKTIHLNLNTKIKCIIDDDTWP